METSARLLQMLSLLQAKRDWTSAEFAARLGVSPRTVRADVSKLRALGYSVEARPGVAGGYRLGMGSVMPPLLLDDDEAVAIAIGLGVVAMGTPGAKEASLTSLAKLEQVLPARLRQRVDAVMSSSSAVDATTPPLDLPTLSAIASAIRGHHTLRFGYTKPNQHHEARHTEPRHLVNWGTLWYLLAWDLARMDWRIFRVDRITLQRPTGMPFVPRSIPGHDPVEFVTQRIVTAGDAQHARVRFCAPATRITSKCPFPVTVESSDDSTCIVTIMHGEPGRLAIWLTQLDMDFDILEASELQRAVGSIAARLFRAAGSPGPRP